MIPVFSFTMSITLDAAPFDTPITKALFIPLAGSFRINLRKMVIYICIDRYNYYIKIQRLRSRARLILENFEFSNNDCHVVITDEVVHCGKVQLPACM